MAEISYPGSWGPVWFAESLTTAALTGIAIVAGHSRVPAVSLPWLAFLGRISYSTYLMHAMILDLFVLGGHRMTVGRTAIYLPIVLGVSISDAGRARFVRGSERGRKRQHDAQAGADVRSRLKITIQADRGSLASLVQSGTTI